MEAVLARSAALILLVVFGFKAALLPLSLWLPGTYAAASAPVAALFAIMTKVGVYAILRVHGVIFGDGAGEVARVAEPWLLPLAMGTSVLGVLGALAARNLPRLVAWLTVASVGTILAALGLFTPAAWSAALYYLAHSTLVVAGLFLLVELVAAQRGDVADELAPASPVAQPVLLGLMLLAGGCVGGRAAAVARLSGQGHAAESGLGQPHAGLGVVGGVGRGLPVHAGAGARRQHAVLERAPRWWPPRCPGGRQRAAEPGRRARHPLHRRHRAPAGRPRHLCPCGAARGRR
jgi:hypothetical protein